LVTWGRKEGPDKKKGRGLKKKIENSVNKIEPCDEKEVVWEKLYALVDVIKSYETPRLPDNIK